MADPTFAPASVTPDTNWLAQLPLSELTVAPMFLWGIPLFLGLTGLVFTLIDDRIGGPLNRVARLMSWLGFGWLAVMMTLCEPAIVLCVPWFLLLGLFKGPEPIENLR